MKKTKAIPEKSQRDDAGCGMHPLRPGTIQGFQEGLILHDITRSRFINKDRAWQVALDNSSQLLWKM